MGRKESILPDPMCQCLLINACVSFTPTGVTVWEIMTFGAHPYHGKPIGDILKALECNERLPQPVTVTADLHSILVSCKR